MLAAMTATISGTTRVVGILGDPISHTLSPRMHNAAYAALGLDYVYVPFHADPARIGDVVRSIRTLGIAGFNVTVPYKEKVLRYLDERTSAAEAIGAVNTIWLRKGAITGDNTDAPGFHQALVDHRVRTRGQRVLVVGAGGSSRAVLFSLLERGAADVVVANRTVSKARALLQRFDPEGARSRAVGLDALTDRDFLATRTLVVNCTSVGLHGARYLDYEVSATPQGCVHYDLAYGAKLTAFLAAAHRRGRPVIDGRHMLVHQGALAFRHFTGRKAPVDVMLAALMG